MLEEKGVDAVGMVITIVSGFIDGVIEYTKSPEMY